MNCNFNCSQGRQCECNPMAIQMYDDPITTPEKARRWFWLVLFALTVMVLWGMYELIAYFGVDWKRL